MAGARDRYQLRSHRDERQRRFHLVEGSESVTCAVNEECRCLQAREVRRPQFRELLRRMKRVGEQQQCFDKAVLVSRQHRCLPASIGMAPEKNPARSQTLHRLNCRAKPLLIPFSAAPLWRPLRTQLAEREIATK